MRPSPCTRNKTPVVHFGVDAPDRKRPRLPSVVRWPDGSPQSGPQMLGQIHHASTTAAEAGISWDDSMQQMLLPSPGRARQNSSWATIFFAFACSICNLLSCFWSRNSPERLLRKESRCSSVVKTTVWRFQRVSQGVDQRLPFIANCQTAAGYADPLEIPEAIPQMKSSSSRNENTTVCSRLPGALTKREYLRSLHTFRSKLILQDGYRHPTATAMRSTIDLTASAAVCTSAMGNDSSAASAL